MTPLEKQEIEMRQEELRTNVAHFIENIVIDYIAAAVDKAAPLNPTNAEISILSVVLADLTARFDSDETPFRTMVDALIAGLQKDAFRAGRAIFQSEMETTND